MISSPSKSRSDSTLDSQLDPLQADLFFERLENGLSLRDGAAWLLAEHGLTLSEMSLSRWAAKRRRARVDADFAAALDTLQADRAQAAVLLDGQTDEAPPDAAAEFAQANLLLAQHALFVALRGGDPDRIAQAVRVVTALQNSQAQQQRVETARRTAERMQKHREFAAVRSIIQFENQLFLSNEGREALRDALDIYLNPDDQDDAPPAPAAPEPEDQPPAPDAPMHFDAETRAWSAEPPADAAAAETARVFELARPEVRG